MLSRKTVLFFIIGLGLAIYFFHSQNNSLVLSSHTVEIDNLPESFADYTIVHLSDLHSAEFGEANERLLSLVEEQDADLIFMTGDLIDSYTTDSGQGVSLMEELVQMAPVYYVTGNHEWRLGIVDELASQLTEIGVTVLRNNVVAVEKNGDILQIAGIEDPDYDPSQHGDQVTIHSLDLLKLGDDYPTLLLAHRPEHFSVYQQKNIDLVFSGHAHGGQIRLPIIGGILSPGQGLFPAYSEGIYSENNTLMSVSRGLGNSIFPLRLFNRPEVVRIELQP